MTPILLFVHGWGFDASVWSPLRATLKPDQDSMTWDLGYYGQPAQPVPPANRPVIAIGHSLGVLWLLHHRPLPWRALVSINGFPRFSKSADFPEGVPSRLIERMLARLHDTPVEVHGDFLARCGLPAHHHPAAQSTNPLDVDALADGLIALRDWDERAGTQIDLALAGRADPIVSAAMTQASFTGQPIEWQDGGHLLPLTAPGWCADRLDHFLESFG